MKQEIINNELKLCRAKAALEEESLPVLPTVSPVIPILPTVQPPLVKKSRLVVSRSPPGSPLPVQPTPVLPPSPLPPVVATPADDNTPLGFGLHERRTYSDVLALGLMGKAGTMTVVDHHRLNHMPGCKHDKSWSVDQARCVGEIRWRSPEKVAFAKWLASKNILPIK